MDAEARGGFDGVAHGVDAGAMAFDARQVALRGPAAVAVHDDGDVRRQPLEVHLPRTASRPDAPDGIHASSCSSDTCHLPI